MDASQYKFKQIKAIAVDLSHMGGDRAEDYLYK